MNGTSSFGESYAVLNLDWMTILVNGIKDEPEGAALIANWSKWNDAVHQKPSRPLSIFVTLAFSPGQPELDPNSPFANLIASYGKFIAGSPEVQVDKRFKIDEQDLIVQKTRLSASIGNSLEQILKAKGIKTVIIVRDMIPSGCYYANPTTKVWLKPFGRRNGYYLSIVRFGLPYLCYKRQCDGNTNRSHS